MSHYNLLSGLQPSFHTPPMFNIYDLGFDFRPYVFESHQTSYWPMSDTSCDGFLHLNDIFG